MSSIAFFIPHKGCPQRCSFCEQNTISGIQNIPNPLEVKQILDNTDSNKNLEISFFGGSFTALPRDYMLSLLETAKAYLPKFKSIRISTRPDCINCEILETLKCYGVTAIELGAQSMSDEVLSANNRGHSVKDILAASELIKKHGFELGLQMMTGLYKSTPKSDLKTGYQIADISPDTVRIYPIVVLENTQLGELFLNGEYVPYPFEECLEVCAELLLMFHKRKIKVIKCGLHSSEDLAKKAIAGYYHPSFRELAENHVYRKLIKSDCFVGDKCISKVLGYGGKEYYKSKNINIMIDKDLGIFEICTLNR